MQTKIVVEAEIRPTEDEDKVKRAVLNFIDPDKIEIMERGTSKILYVEASSVKSLSKLHRALRLERVLDAARNALKRGIRDNKIVFYLHKQAAYMGRVSIVSGDVESPMGAIKFEVEYKEPSVFIDWIAPQTSRGKPLWEIDIEG